MSRLRLSITMSLDGYVAGPEQSEQNPLGVGGMELHEWFFPLAAFREMHGEQGGEVNVSTAVVEERRSSVGATIMGRNMFGPVRGSWGDEAWRGWWGDDPPYHHPVFVLTHHPRAPLTMAGGTQFHFITAGIHAALEQARSAAGGRDVRVGGGVATIRQYLREGLIDELHLVMPPVLLGCGEHLLQGIDLRALGYACTRSVAGERATHLYLRRER